VDDTSTVYAKMSAWMDLVTERLNGRVVNETQPVEKKLSYKAWRKLSKVEQVALARQKVRGCG